MAHRRSLTSHPRVQLDRAQRDAIRSEVRLAGSAWGDIGLGLGRGRDGPDRDFVIRQLAQIRGAVAMLDAIGWLEAADSPDVVDFSVAPDLAGWAGRQAAELVRAFTEMDVDDGDLDALTAMSAIARGAEET
jgi:hypothetical protein